MFFPKSRKVILPMLVSFFDIKKTNTISVMSPASTTNMASTVLLKIDHRECLLKEAFKDVAEFSNLVYGDIIVEVNGEALVVMERKTLADLAASIKDGRYKNQKVKLLESCKDSSVIYYIVEGPFDYFDMEGMIYGISKKALVSAVINTMIRDNIKVMVTRNLHETTSMIKGLFTRVQECPEKYTPRDTDEIEDTRVVSKPKSGSGGVLSKSECFEYQLCQIPDISRKTAQAIMKSYPSFRELYSSLNVKDDAEKLKSLKDLTIQDSKGKDRRISERALKNLIEYIF